MTDYSTWSLEGMKVRITSELKFKNLPGNSDSIEGLIGICRGIGAMGKILFTPGRNDYIVNLMGNGKDIKSYDGSSLERALAIAILNFLDTTGGS